MDWNGWSWERGAEGGFWARSGIAHRTCETGKRGWGQLGSGGRGRGFLDVLVCRPRLLNIRVSLESGRRGWRHTRGQVQGDKTVNVGRVAFPGRGVEVGKRGSRKGPPVSKAADTRREQ